MIHQSNDYFFKYILFLECKYNKTLEEISRVLIAKIENDKRNYSTHAALNIATGLLDKLASWNEIVNGVCVNNLTEIIYQELSRRFYWHLWSVVYVANLSVTQFYLAPYPPKEYKPFDFGKLYGIEAALYYTKRNNKLSHQWFVFNKSEYGFVLNTTEYEHYTLPYYKDVTHAIFIAGQPRPPLPGINWYGWLPEFRMGSLSRDNICGGGRDCHKDNSFINSGSNFQFSLFYKFPLCIHTLGVQYFMFF